jgi:hypothetical protein
MAKTKTEIEKIDVKRAPITLKVSCGSCIFLTKAGAYSNSKGDVTCESFGTVASSQPCHLYTPDPKKMVKDDNLGKYLEILAGCANPHALAAALFSRTRVKRMGFILGEEVYFHVMGGDFVCNYASGRIIGAVRQTLVIEGIGCTAMYKPESLMHIDEWEEKLGVLLTKDRVNDPNGGLRRVGSGKNLSLRYIPPLLQSASRPLAKKKGRKKKNTYAAITLS